MNQFKRAKSERINSGKPVEKASDLTTAGTKESTKEVSKKETIELTPVIEEKETAPIITNDISPIKAEIDQPVDTDLDTSDTDISNPKDISSIQPEETIQVTIPEPVAPTKEATIPSEQPVQLETPSNPAPVVHNNLIIEEKKNVIHEAEPTYTAHDTPAHTPAIPVDTVIVQPQVISPANSFNNMQPQLQSTSGTLMQPQIIPVVTPTVEQLNSQISANYQIYQEPTVIPVVKEPTIKKSAPNIFHNKGESKSVRKSLVLKPTSVKIAENYCSKNGGSFNELIQHLLDNFIDEYGLR